MNATNMFKSLNYSDGVKEFMALAHKCVYGAHRVWCPCRMYNNNSYYKPISVVEDHLWLKGFN